MRRWRCLPVLLLAVCLAGCGARGRSAAVTVQPTAAPTPAAAESEVCWQGRPLTLEEKVGQLFLVRPDALDPALTSEQVHDADGPGVTELSDAMRRTLQEIPVGGVVVFGKNLVSPDQITEFLRQMQQASAVPLFTGVDEEGGTVARLANQPGFDLPRFESAAAVGASGDPADAEAMAFTIATYLKQFGFTLDFAPVADLNTNPENPVIGDRAFGSDPDTVAALVGAACDGFARAGVACTLKHFPGHGDTTQDTHDGPATTEKTLDELLSCELVPFARNLDKAPLVMAAHIAVPAVTGDDTPASLCGELLTGVLRQQLGYQGLIVTDSLAMGAITGRCSSGEAAVQAILAGADLLLMPENLREAYDAVLDAVRDGTIPEQRLDESVQRILQCKQRYCLTEG